MYVIQDNNMSMYDFFVSLKHKQYRDYLIQQLKSVPYTEYYLHFPIVSYKTAKKTPFVLKIKKAPRLLTCNGPNDTHTFNFDECTNGIRSIAFMSITGNSYLVIPCPYKQDNTHYDCGHIAQFMRHAKIEYIHDFWKKISDVFFHYFHTHPTKMFELLTHGHDVYWLHAKFVFK